MSFILDALKKSEAERRQGEIPSLQNEIASAAPRRRTIWPFLLILALLLNGAVLGGWLFLRKEEPPPEASSSGELDRIISARAALPEPAREIAANSAPLAEDEGEAAAIVKASPAEPAVPSAQSETSGSLASAPAKPAGGISPAVSKAPATAAIKAPAEVPDPSVLPETGGGPVQPVRPAKQIQPAKPKEQSVRPKPAVTAKAPDATPALAEAFPLLSELPADVRSGLPGLNLQLHFFSPDPARRLVRLNGFNLREGDRGGDGLEVVEITPDGIRLSCRGVRFFLPNVRR